MRHVAILVLVSIALAAAGCGGATENVEGGCAYVVEVKGQKWYGVHVGRRPPLADRAGNGRVPDCDDGFGPSGGHDVALAVVPGLDPDEALGVVEDEHVVLVREQGVLPPAVEQLITPGCRAADGLIALSGMWVAVFGPDGRSTDDLAPPYDVRLMVGRASVPYYEGANLVVRVPAALGRPLDRADVREVLYRAGELHLTVRCDGAGYVAETVRAVRRAG